MAESVHQLFENQEQLRRDCDTIEVTIDEELCPRAMMIIMKIYSYSLHTKKLLIERKLMTVDIVIYVILFYFIPL